MTLKLIIRWQTLLLEGLQTKLLYQTLVETQINHGIFTCESKTTYLSDPEGEDISKLNLQESINISFWINTSIIYPPIIF